MCLLTEQNILRELHISLISLYRSYNFVKSLALLRTFLKSLKIAQSTPCDCHLKRQNFTHSHKHKLSWGQAGTLPRTNCPSCSLSLLHEDNQHICHHSFWWHCSDQWVGQGSSAYTTTHRWRSDCSFYPGPCPWSSTSCFILMIFRLCQSLTCLVLNFIPLML